MSPIEALGWSSKIGSQVVPALVVFQSPPVAAPTYTILGLLFTPSTSVMRPPGLAGPISLQVKLLINSSVSVCEKSTAAETKNKSQDRAETDVFG